MALLPRRLLVRLTTADAGVVAPVGLGLGVQALCDWARVRGWAVLDGPPDADPRRTAQAAPAGGWLWCPARRADLSQLTPAHAQALILTERDLLLDADDWAQALPGQDAAEQAASFASAAGWPAALALAQTLPGDAAPHLHPRATALLGPLLPPAPLLPAARALAAAAALTPATAEALGVPRQALDALHDGGWLWDDPRGWVFAPTLRRWLCPHPDPTAARRAADALHDGGHEAAALATLAEAGLWGEYLTLVAQTARAGQGEAALRAALQPLPAHWRDAPAAQYVAGLLARACGDVAAAESLYSRALAAGLDERTAALARNARGVVHAMRGEVDAALADFDAAAQVGGRTSGEAVHNRAALLVQLGRHAEAELSLEQAVAAFRAAGDLAREVRSLQTLGSLNFGRGLLREALEPFERTLRLVLPALPLEAVRSHLNLAECLLWLGEAERVQQHLAAAQALAAAHPSALNAGWIARLRALVHLQAGEDEAALGLLAGVRIDDRGLNAEIALLRGRALRGLGRDDEARKSLDEARPLGVRTELEAALLDAAGLDDLIEAARQEEARLELATALLRRGSTDDLDEALQLIRSHGYLALLHSRAAAPLAARAQDAATRALFPLRIQALGPLRVSHAGRVLHLADFPTRKSAALLVALALSHQAQNRDQLAERFWPGAKNPLASLQTAVYHLRSTFGVQVVGSERGLMQLQFPARTDVDELRQAQQRGDMTALAAFLHALPVPALALPELPAELADERAQAERSLHDAMRAFVDAQPATHVGRRDALRILIAADPLDTDSREDLIRWHEWHGEDDLAEHERRLLKEALGELGVD